MNQLVRFDTSSLNKGLIGFDRLFDDFEKRFSNSVQTSYPPYNILKTSDDDYIIEVAVTGFTKDEITVQVDQEQLIIKATGKKEQATTSEYLHRGLATRDFERRFTLAEYMQVGDGAISDGLLRVFLKRIVPETLKPRTISLTST